jgi:hypothetical protein
VIARLARPCRTNCPIPATNVAASALIGTGTTFARRLDLALLANVYLINRNNSAYTLTRLGLHRNRGSSRWFHSPI